MKRLFTTFILFATSYNIFAQSIIEGINPSTNANDYAIKGTILSTAPGGFSAGVRGQNNGTSGLGIGVYGSQAGSGWGVYGITPSGIGVYGNSTSGFGLYGNSANGTAISGVSNTGMVADFSITNAANTSNAVGISSAGTGKGLILALTNTSNTSSGINVAHSGIGSGLSIQLTNASNGARGVDVTQSGVGPGVFATSTGGNGVWGITSSISAAGVIGDNTFGEAVVGRNQGGVGVGAVVGRNDGAGYGVRGFNTKTGIGVLGQAGISGGTGVGGRFENVNAANTSDVLQAATNGIGSGLTVKLTNASNGGRGVDVTHSGVGPGVFATSSGGNGVWGITSSISAAGVIGDNGGGGEAVVGRASHSDPNRDGGGVGAVVGRNDMMNGYGVRGFVTRSGAIGVLGQAGISGGVNIAGRFENVNAANTSDVLQVLSNSTSNLVVLKKSGANVARIDATGKGFFNGGTQSSGADIAEAFEVEGNRKNYEAGDVMIISINNDRTLAKSDGAYSNLVVGVYATKPGVLLTEESIDNLESDQIPLGVVGVIPTKVCLEGGEIKRGDFLVTSSQSGVAMKGDLSKIKVGQLIGKALQDYNNEGVGKIKVLVNVR
ncbi:beta strand repeat-containing protein [Emticicia sp. SJ17W-69]|uniref:beta strand repeat-containing protein n=1 Tax=Emticicia sp. SJ17W-69 TaxID=3421657 RepID=UPI003EBEDD41